MTNEPTLRGQSNLATGRIDFILWSHEPTTKILRCGRRKGKLGLPLGTGSLGVGSHQVLGHRIFRVSCQWASTSRKLWSKWPQVDQVDRKSAKSSRVVKSSTSRWSRSTKQPSRSFRPTRSTTGSTGQVSCVIIQDILVHPVHQVNLNVL